MSKISIIAAKEVETLRKNQNMVTRMNRLAKPFTKKLRSLPAPSMVSLPWWETGITYTWNLESDRIKTLATKVIEKLSIFTPLENITCEDNSRGEKLIHTTVKIANPYIPDEFQRIHFSFTLKPLEGTLSAKPTCRKVLVGQDTHTITTPRYQLICEE